MNRRTWIAAAAGALALAIPIVTLAAPPFAHTHQRVPVDIVAATAISTDETGATTARQLLGTSYRDTNDGLQHSYIQVTVSTSGYEGGVFVLVLRTLSCPVASAAISVNRLGGAIAATLLDPFSPLCFNVGYTYRDDTGEYDYSSGGFPGVVGVSATLDSPTRESSGTQMVVTMDHSTGARYRSNCVSGSGSQFQGGGLSINGEFFVMGSDGFSDTQYSNCSALTRQ